jgi:hypothetical protein
MSADRHNLDACIEECTRYRKALEAIANMPPDIFCGYYVDTAREALGLPLHGITWGYEPALPLTPDPDGHP